MFYTDYYSTRWRPGSVITWSIVNYPDLLYLPYTNIYVNVVNILDKFNNVFYDITNIGLKLRDFIVFIGKNEYSLYQLNQIVDNKVIRLKLVSSSNTISFDKLLINDLISEFNESFPELQDILLIGDLDCAYLNMNYGSGNIYLILSN